MECQKSIAARDQRVRGSLPSLPSLLPIDPRRLESLVWSFVYFALGRMVQLVLLGFRRRDSKEIEILVLRHELDIAH